MSFQVPRSSRVTGGVGDFEGTEHGRNIQSSSRVGVIQQLDLEKVRARVVFGDPQDAQSQFVSGWLPFIQPAASIGRSGVSAWQPPQVGDLVQVVCPGGELSMGQILPVNHMRPKDLPFNDRADGYHFGELGETRTSVYRKLFADGTLIEYDIGQKMVRVETPGSIKAHACGQILMHAPFIQLDAEQVHVTGKLLLSDQVIGMKKDLSGTQLLDFLGDTIELNNQGGMFGVAMGLVSSFGLSTLSGAIGNFGNFGSLFSGLTSIAGPMQAVTNFIGSTGLSSLIPSSVLGAVTSIAGASGVMGPLSTAMGFAQQLTATGALQFPQDPWQMAGLALDVAAATGAPLPPGAGLVTDVLGNTVGNFDGQATITGWLGNNITMEQLTEVAGASGLLPTDAAGLNGVVQGIQSALENPTPDANGLVPSPVSFSAGDLMNGLADSPYTSITNPELAEAIWNGEDGAGQAQGWEMLYHGGVSPGDMMSDFVNAGQIDLESLLGLATDLQREGNGPTENDNCDIQVKSDS